MKDLPKDVVNSLLNDGRLDGLLVEARKHAAALAMAGTKDAVKSQLNSALDDVTKQAAAIRDGLVNAVLEQEKQREYKVAIVRQMLHVGSRLLPA